ncbi:hypothetical protein [Paenibacillus sp. XY044]|uniref:phosphoribosyltransferase-like protein n=1 Tax=Paenibacillus sp. XY044 TaxID=2026089 RepID=UPI000B984A50|nr:hypothetical protein [Paenibacillus sp. XY044]OZB93679.1 hypothetical protein CJP46_22070 [Paenibacillus sp. XY044]
MGFYKLLAAAPSISEVSSLHAHISLITQRHKHAIDEIDILHWLDNFEKADRNIALALLNKVDYLDDAQIIEAYNALIERLLASYPGNSTFYILPIGDFGKSATAMIYFFRKTQQYDQKQDRLIIVKHKNMLKKVLGSNEYLIFIDDYFGSGRSCVKFYKQHIESIYKKHPLSETIWLSIAAQEQAIEYLNANVPNPKVLTWMPVEKAFKRDRSPFGNYNKMKEYRELAYKYGFILDTKGPLGYDNTQGLVTFSYGSPNNLLPIFWSSKRLHGGNRWRPLFPRYSTDKIQMAKEYRKETMYWLSLTETLDHELFELFATGKRLNNEKNFEYSYIQRIDFRLFALIRLIRQRRSLPVIMKILGIVESDYHELIMEGVKRNLVDKDGKLSEYGSECYKRISRKILLFQENNHVTNSTDFSKVYVPSSFRGST